MKIRGIPIKYWINPKYWWHYVKGHFLSKMLEREFVEQLMFRMTTEECKPCLDKGTCIVCGCKTYPKMILKESECAHLDEYGSPLWGQMLPKKEWEEYKELVGLEFYRKFNKISENSITEK